MNRELNELKSTGINRAGFIGTVINMPEAPREWGLEDTQYPAAFSPPRKEKRY